MGGRGRRRRGRVKEDEGKVRGEGERGKIKTGERKRVKGREGKRGSE